MGWLAFSDALWWNGLAYKKSLPLGCRNTGKTLGYSLS
jgi:hypothetical protein